MHSTNSKPKAHPKGLLSALSFKVRRDLQTKPQFSDKMPRLVWFNIPIMALLVINTFVFIYIVQKLCKFRSQFENKDGLMAQYLLVYHLKS